MNIGSGEDDTYNLIKEGLKASNLRAKAIANNMANINTKDYKRFNVVFEENLQKDSGSELALKRTNDAHFSADDEQSGNISIEQDKGTSMRADGNNVDLDIEKVNQAANTLKYNALITSINHQFSDMKMVMNK